MIMQRELTYSWSFSGLPTMVGISLMYYVDFYILFNHPEKDWKTYSKLPLVNRSNHHFLIKGAWI